MPGSVRLRQDYSSRELRWLASRSKDANQSRRLLSLAAVLDGMSRADAARIGGMDRQTLRDWVHRFNQSGPDGLFDHWATGPASRLSVEQKAKLAEIVEVGLDHGGGRRGSLAPDRPSARHQRAVRGRVSRAPCGWLLKKLGFSHMSARPLHPGQDAATVAAFKTYGSPRLQVLCVGDPSSLRQRIRSREKPGQDEASRVSILINFTAANAIF